MAAVSPAIQRIDGISRRALTFGAVGVLALVAGLFLSREQFFRAYLVAFVFWSGIGLGCTGILLLHNVTGGAWGVGTRRLLESGARTVPWLALLFIPVILGLKDLYMWARPEVMAHDLLLQKKALYLNVPFFLGRSAFYFLVWSFVALRVSHLSLSCDEKPSKEDARKLRLTSGSGLALYVMTVTFASVDWVMSLDPHWFSTIFGALFMVGQVLSAFAFIIPVTILLSREKPMNEVVTPGTVYDLGNLLLAFVMLWAYLAFSQFLIIYAGNLPEEIPWYLERLKGGWKPLALGIIFLHFVFPFMMLVSRATKRNAGMLLPVAVLVVVMRIVETYWVVIPSGESHAPFGVQWVAVAALVGLGGLWIGMFLRELKNRWHVVGHDRHVSPEEPRD